MFLRQGILLFILLDFTTSHPSQKRETGSASVSESSQTIINDERSINTEPASSLPHTAAPSYYNLKEAIENSVGIYNRHSAASMIDESSPSSSPKHVKKTLGESQSDTANLKVPAVLNNESIRYKVDPHETSIKSIKSYIEILPTLSKRSKGIKAPKFKFRGWSQWNNLWLRTPKTGGAARGIQSAQNMQNFLAKQTMQPGKISQNSMAIIDVKKNHVPKVHSRFKKGVRIGWFKQAGRKNFRAEQKSKAKVAKGQSSATSPATIPKTPTVSNAPVKLASERKILKRPISHSDDSKTKAHSSTSKIQSKSRFRNAFRISGSQSKTTVKPHNKGRKNSKLTIPDSKTKDYNSSSDNEKSDSSSSKLAKSAKRLRFWKKVEPSNSDTDTGPAPPKPISVANGNKISPDNVPPSDNEKPKVTESGTNPNPIPGNTPTGVKNQNPEEVVRNRDVDSVNQERMSDGGEMDNYNQASSPPNIRRPPNDDDIDRGDNLMERGGGGPGDYHQMEREGGGPGDYYQMERGGGGPGDYHQMEREGGGPGDYYQMERGGGGPGDYYQIERGGGGPGENNGPGTITRIGQAIGEMLPVAANIANIITGNGNMGHGAAAYSGGAHDSMEHMGGGGMHGYGGGGNMHGYGGGGNMHGYGGGGNMNGYGGGDHMDAHDLLGESQKISEENSTQKSITKPKEIKEIKEIKETKGTKKTKKTKETKETKNESKKESKKDHEGDENDNHDQNANNEDQKSVHNPKSKDTADKSSDHPSEKLEIDSIKKNDTITFDNNNDTTGDKISLQDKVELPNDLDSQSDV